MVFQKSNPFPKSIYDNIAYGLRIAGITKRARIDEAVEKSLRSAALWDEVKDRLHVSGYGLSGGQQQRLCIARALAVEPEIVLMDEPCSALDPIATAKVEELIRQLKTHYTIVIVTHNMQQAGRISDNTAFFYLGRLIEFSDTRKIFSQSRATADGRLHHRTVSVRSHRTTNVLHDRAEPYPRNVRRSARLVAQQRPHDVEPDGAQPRSRA